MAVLRLVLGLALGLPMFTWTELGAIHGLASVDKLFPHLVTEVSFNKDSEAGGTPSSVPKRVILDSDIGDDIDDAFALALALKSPELKIEGVSTVHGPVEKQAKIMLKILHLAGRDDIPVYVGLPGQGSKKHEPNQAKWAANYETTKPKSINAIDFMIHTVIESEGDITIIAYGPLTNVAAALKREPRLAKAVKQIVLMGGSIFEGYQTGSQPEPEYNIAGDPEAARAVLESGAPILMVPLDATNSLQLEVDNLNKVNKAGTPLTQALWELYQLWSSQLWGVPIPTLFDPMTIVMAIDRRFSKEIRKMKIEIEGEYTRLKEGTPNVEVCLVPRKEEFLLFFMERLLSK